RSASSRPSPAARKSATSRSGSRRRRRSPARPRRSTAPPRPPRRSTSSFSRHEARLAVYLPLAFSMSVVSLGRVRSAAMFRSWPLRPLGQQAAAPTAETADRWLIGLRWIAIGGMLVTTLIGKRLVPDIDLFPILAVLAGLVALNLGWRLLVARRVGRPALLAPQIVLDV